MAGLNRGRGMPVMRVAEPDDAPAIARVHVDSWHSTYRGILSDAIIASRSYESRLAQWARTLSRPEPDHVYVVADVDSEVVGFAAGGPARGAEAEYDAELYAIYLRAGEQRRGLGRALAGAVATDLYRRGKCSLLVWVLSDNASRAFYERLGAIPVRTALLAYGDEEYEEMAYGWLDIQVLLASTRARE